MGRALPAVRVVGVEVCASRTLRPAAIRGETALVEPTLADGMAGGVEAGSITIEIARRHVAGFVAVTEQELRAAMRTLAFGHGILVEGSGAAAPAALLAGKVTDERPGAKITAIASGMNIAAETALQVLGEVPPAGAGVQR